MAININKLIPKMTDQKFRANLRAIGVVGYDIVSPTSIILYGSTRSRSDKKQVLIELAEILKSYGAQYAADKKTDSGFISLGNTKIMLKPDRVAGGITLKSSFFGTNITKIVDKNIPFSSYYSSVISAINTTNRLTDMQKEVLLILAEEASNPSQETKTKVKNTLKYVGQTLPIASINNDFSEVLGPLAVINRGLLPIDGSSAVVKVAGSSDEALVDYKITDGQSEYKISTQSGTITNIQTPDDLINAIEKDGMTEQNFYFKKWGRTPQYKVLKIIQHATMNQGPIEAAMWLRDNGYQSYFSWLRNAEYSEEVRQRCEDTLIKISTEALDFTDIFSDAIKTKVYYVRFKLSFSGDMEWKLVENAEDRREKRKVLSRVVLSSSNSVKRARQKIGFRV
jgi:LysM repeat protein